MKPIIAITTGDINGVGCEIVLKTLAHQHVCEVCTPIIYGNQAILRKHMENFAEEVHNIQFNVIQSPREAKEGKINLITCYGDDTPLNLGESTAAAGKASFASLERACKDVKDGLAHALVTAPINKENIQSENFNFTGHTEYLESVFGAETLMMMVSDVMRVALVCNHVAIREVPSKITVERILHKLTILNKALQDDFSIRKPRIAVLALNPHCGDNGLIGTEEKEIIKPAVAKANEQGIWAFGPFSADGFFGVGAYIHYDAVLAMYHDQGLIPFKTLDMNGVNYTAGLPVVRTSPDHGTGYDKTGKNIANVESFAHALFAAIDIMKRREENKELNENRLIIEQ